MTRHSLAMLVAVLLAQPLGAVTCEDTSFDGASFTICEADASSEEIALFLRGPEGQILGQFTRIDRTLNESGRRLSFAMNAGMYHDDRSPVGLYVEDGKRVMRVVSSAGPGNFGLLPNGVFCLRSARADVIETTSFVSQNIVCDDATQSGPMLVIKGALHPRFLENGTSLYIRNGVGTSPDGSRVVFAISNEPVNFHHFGRLFRDQIGVPNALYFDGNISRLHAPDLDRSDFGFALGPIVGIVEPLE